MSKVTIAALTGHQSNGEIAAEFDVYPTHVNTCQHLKEPLLHGSAQIFDKQPEQAENVESECEYLHSKIGQLKVVVQWLKKRPVIATKSAGKAGDDRTQSSGY
jgi:hypothetical protein